MRTKAAPSWNILKQKRRSAGAAAAVSHYLFACQPYNSGSVIAPFAALLPAVAISFAQ